MKKIIILTIIFSIVYASENVALVITNKCETCSYIDLDLSGYNYEDEYVYHDGHLGGYDTYLTWPVPAGEYSFHALCESGGSKGFVWIDSLTLTGSTLEEQHNLYCPPPDITTTIFPTTTTVPEQPCLSEEIYGEDLEEAELLRNFRDNVLNQTSEGRELIRLYYQWGPVIVKAMEEDEEFKKGVKGMIDGILPLIESQIE